MGLRFATLSGYEDTEFPTIWEFTVYYRAPK